MLEYYRFKTVHDLFVKGFEEEARVQLAELQKRYVALCDENTTYKMQMEEYEDILYLARNLTRENGFYWLTTGSIKQGPFCPSCYDNDGLLMRLAGEDYDRHCPSCRSSFAPEQKKQEAAIMHARQLVEQFQAQPAPRKKRATVLPFNRQLG